jgi:hypothetical protein
MSYYKRNKNLRRIGFDSYQAYLQSNLWRTIKEQALIKLGDKCVVCKKKADILHHTDYSIIVLLGKDISKLRPLCHGHYKNIKLSKKVVIKRLKLTPPKANVRLGTHSKKKCRFCSKKMICNDICKYCRIKYATFLLDEASAYNTK